MKVLIVDDEEKIANTLAERLRLRGLETSTAYTGKSALTLLGRENFDCIILDLRLPDIDGVDILRLVMKEFLNVQVAIMSGHGTEEDFRICMELGAIACFQKPANINNLIEALTGATNKRNDKIQDIYQPG